MNEEYEFIELTPDAYESIQHEITSSVAENSRQIENCSQAICVGNQKIQELEDEISRIQSKINEYKGKLLSNQRSIKVDTNFLNKINRRVNRNKPTIVDIERRLVKSYRK